MSSLESDANLDRAREFEGYKVLPPCVLYGKIGQGGMGAVYRGRHLNLDIDVAVKCLKPDLTGDEDDQFIVRFRREARSAARINHQNVVRVFDVSEEKGLHYIVMELVQGETARQRVQRKKRIGIGEALEILYGAANGLGEAHSKGFIHRDVKPDNIMISASGQVKVADLGLAKPSGASNLSMLSGTNMVMGTPQYMPPEQWENTATVTPAADVWALGATLYYLLVGGEAIAKDSLPRIMQRIVMQAFPDVREQRPDCPEDVALLIAKATERDPDKRFADAREMARAIERLETRRDTLTDCETVLEGDQNTLLSPPPAKTLAKIKFWLDEQSMRGGEGVVAPTQGRTQPVVEPNANATVAHPMATVPVPAPARRGGGLFAAIAVLLVGAAALFVWKSTQGGLFAQADALEKSGSFALAVAEVERVHGEDPSLSGKAERLGRLYAAWARQALDAGELRQALLHAGQALGYADNDTSRKVENEVVQQVTSSLEQALVRTSPGVQPVERGKPVEFVGRLADPLVRDLRIARQSVLRDAVGGFRTIVELRDATSASVELTLTTGRVLVLAEWPVVYAKPAAAGNGEPVTQKPVVESQDKPSNGEPGTAVERPIGPALAALPECEVRLSADRLELVGDEPARLVISVSEDSEVFVDGVQLARPTATGEVVHEVRSELVTPADVLVEVRSPASRPAQRRVPVIRRDGELRFDGALDPVGLKKVRDKWLATSADEVQVRGRLSVPGAKLSVDGFGEVPVEWGESGAFTATVRVPRTGENRLRLRATRRFHRPGDCELVVLKLAAPEVTPFGTTRLVDQVSTSTYEVCLQADEWTEKVTVGSGATAVTLRKDRDGTVFRGTCRLSMGVNVLPIVAVNVLDQPTTRELRIERVAVAAPAVAPAAGPVVPVLTGLAVKVGDKETDVMPRPGVNSPTIYIKEVGSLVVRTTDPNATVLINNNPVQRQADMTVSLAGIVEEAKKGGRATPVSVVIKNALGQTPVTTFFVWLDSTEPTITCKTPTLTVAKGQAFTLEGDYEDNVKVRSNDCRLGELPIVLQPQQGREGSWKLMHPGLQASTVLGLEFTDMTGNTRILEVTVTVQ